MTARPVLQPRGVVVPLPLRRRPVPRFVLSYTPGMACPGCAGTNWHVGRVGAECGRCGFAVDLPAEGLRR